MVVKFEPFWYCINCGYTGLAKKGIPDKCPNCQSTNIYRPGIKKGGPFNPDSLKKY